MLSITCSYPQSLHTTPTPINFEAEMKLWEFFPTLVHHYETFTNSVEKLCSTNTNYQEILLQYGDFVMGMVAWIKH